MFSPSPLVAPNGVSRSASATGSESDDSTQLTAEDDGESVIDSESLSSQPANIERKERRQQTFGTMQRFNATLSEVY